MLTTDQQIRLLNLHGRLRDATHWHIRNVDGLHKSSEGWMTIEMHLPDAFDRTRNVKWRVSAYSYLFNDQGRRSEWEAETPDQALALAENAIGDWLMVAETDMMFGLPEAEKDDQDTEHVAATDDNSEIDF